MLHYLGQLLADVSGPFRLLTSFLFLASLGGALGYLITCSLLPKVWKFLPTDKGRAFAVDAEQSVGKPISAGIFFIPVFILLTLLMVPFRLDFVGLLGCVFIAMIVGFLDDRSDGGWSEYRLGAIDMGLAFFATWMVLNLQGSTIWLPLLKDPVQIPVSLYLLGGTLLIWVSINATNCTDGVDGLSASLSSMGILFLGLILYGVVGHVQISDYLLLPHYPLGADWSIIAFIMVGCLAGYLWHNSFPSNVLMGDSGSRPVGLLLGALVLASGNPFLIFVVALVVLLNGATGLIKIALLRFFRIGIFSEIRYPLHDHVRYKFGWSNTQVLVRFMLLQAVVTPILLVLLFKIR